MSFRSIYLVDGSDGGHHLMYLRNFAQVLLSLNCRVVELLPDPSRVEPWFDRHLGAQRQQLRLVPFRTVKVAPPLWRLRDIWTPLARWRQAARAVQAAERQTGWAADLVFFCWLDDYVLGQSPLCRFFIPGLFRYPWAGLFFQPWHLRAPPGEDVTHYAVSSGVLRLRGCRGVAVLDEGIGPGPAGVLAPADSAPVSGTRPGGAPFARRVICFPDATDEELPEVEPARVRHLRAAIRGRKVVGLLGALARRKGVCALLNAAAAAGERDWLVLLVGALGSEQLASYSPQERSVVETALRDPPANVIIVPEHIDDEREFNALIRLCDVLYAAYETFGHSSGLVTKAAVFRKLILVSPGYNMAERVTGFRMGLTVDPHDPQAVVTALATLLDPTARNQALGTPDFEGCHRAHSLPALREAFRALLDG